MLKLGALPPRPLTGSSAGGTACRRPGNAAPDARAAGRRRTCCWGSGGSPASTGCPGSTPHPAGNGVGLGSPALWFKNTPCFPALMVAIPRVCTVLTAPPEPRRGRGWETVTVSPLRKPRKGKTCSSSLSQDGNKKSLASGFWGSLCRKAASGCMSLSRPCR